MFGFWMVHLVELNWFQYLPNICRVNGTLTSILDPIRREIVDWRYPVFAIESTPYLMLIYIYNIGSSFYFTVR